MKTNNKTINSDTWTQLTTEAIFVIQNTSSSVVLIAASDTSPADDDGMKLNPLYGADSNTITGTIWGKALAGKATIAVSE